MSDDPYQLWQVRGAMPLACPFCAEPAHDENDVVSLVYNGSGPPPSYAVSCGNCSAEGPTSMGAERDDHLGAKIDVVRLWNVRAQPEATNS